MTNTATQTGERPPSIRRWLVLVVILVGATVIGVGFGRGPAEPVFENKSLTEWLQLKVGIEPLPAEAVRAVRGIGTNAIPFLQKMATYDESNLKFTTKLLIERLPFVDYQATPYYVIRSRGFDGLKALGPTSIAAFGVVTNCLYSENAFEAAEVLAEWGDAGLGPLLAAAKHEDSILRNAVADALAHYSRTNIQAIRALRELSKDSDADVRTVASKSLQSVESGSNREN